MDMTMTDSPHRSWYDGAGAGTGGREDSDSQLSVAEHMSSLFHHHAAALEPAATRDYPGYRAATVTMTSRYYYQHQQATYAAQQGNYLPASLPQSYLDYKNQPEYPNCTPRIPGDVSFIRMFNLEPLRNFTEDQINLLIRDLYL